MSDERPLQLDEDGVEGAFRVNAVDDRLIRESGTDARIAAILQPVIRALGFRLVRVRLSGQNGLTLQVMAERPDGTMTVEDCEMASRAVSAALDVDDPIDKAYHLEVSSPGIDRPLVRIADFEAWRGHLIKLETSVIVAGRKRFRGVIETVDAEGISVAAEKPSYGEEPVARIPYDTMAEARLILTDDLISEALKADKKARQERKKRRKAGLDDDPGEEPDETGDGPETDEAED